MKSKRENTAPPSGVDQSHTEPDGRVPGFREKAQQVAESLRESGYSAVHQGKTFLVMVSLRRGVAVYDVKHSKWQYRGKVFTADLSGFTAWLKESR